jgi:cyclopropane-fatty-acyl-phospholipid synthase
MTVVTRPLRRELTRLLPHRPFSLRFWDGTQLPRTTEHQAPEFTAHSPAALAHVLRAPG